MSGAEGLFSELKQQQSYKVYSILKNHKILVFLFYTWRFLTGWMTDFISNIPVFLLGVALHKRNWKYFLGSFLLLSQIIQNIFALYIYYQLCEYIMSFIHNYITILNRNIDFFLQKAINSQIRYYTYVISNCQLCWYRCAFALLPVFLQNIIH